VTIASIDQQTAEWLVQGVHAICPYSNAIRAMSMWRSPTDRFRATSSEESHENRRDQE
jgi:hypothetical protein